MNATAHVTDGRAEVWAPHQSYDAIIGSVAGVLGIDPADVTLHTTMLGGGFGRRFEMDFAMQAAVASKAVGRPVQLIWSREEDIRHDWFRPAMVCRLRAGLDASGAMTAFSAEIVGPSVMLHTFPDMIQNGVDPTTVEGLAGLRYAVPNRRVAATLGDTHLNIGFWRSVGHSHNGFFSEGFIDEVAVAAGADPYRFRRTLLAHDARAVAVLDAVAEASGWDTPPPEGRARGIAFHESFGSLVAEVAEVSVERGRPRVHRVWVAIDPGQVINPQQIEAQMHSGVVYGLTAALRGEITFDQGQIVQSNFHDYTPLRMDEMPEIDVTIVVSGAELGGVGEPATPPIAPAVVNALAALTGRRLRSLPLSKHQIEV